MVLFKINGERNSGTNFLKFILKIHGFPVYVERYDKNICYHWKHGIPRSDVKKLNDRVIDIFIFRELNNWLISMSKNTYLLHYHNNFKKFLTVKQSIKIRGLIDYKTNKHLNQTDNNKTIFEIINSIKNK